MRITTKLLTLIALAAMTGICALRQSWGTIVGIIVGLVAGYILYSQWPTDGPEEQDEP